MQKKIIVTDNAPRAIGTYSQAVQVGKQVFLSGQIPLDPKSMVLVSDDFCKQAAQVFDNLQAVCEAAGGSLNHIVKLNLYLTDLSQFSLLNDVMATKFSEPFPARAAVGVKELPRGAQVEADAVMMLD
jgi:reactive intermediate/imine deaminase